ncbi:MAG: hypothetical protein OXG35_12785 [Acidobacteria bacterium]|nr:hypothetical protein [Acidobacteriota bacterium]
MLREVDATVTRGAEIVPELNEEHSADESTKLVMAPGVYPFDRGGWLRPTPEPQDTEESRREWLRPMPEPQDTGKFPILWPVPETIGERAPHNGALLVDMSPMCLGTLDVISARAVCTLLDLTPASGGRTALAFVVAQMPWDIRRRCWVFLTDKGSQMMLNRVPAVLDFATRSRVETVKVDGTPFASPVPPPTRYGAQPQRRQLQRVLPGFPGPRTLNRRQLGNVVMAALSQSELPGDGRSRLRDDIARLGEFAFALSGPATIPEDVGALLVGGRVTTANIARFWQAMEVLRTLTIKVDAVGRWLSLANVDTLPGERVVCLAPPIWWKGKGENHAYRLSGNLWRPMLDQKKFQDIGPGLGRTVSGLEARLYWSETPGYGKYARTPKPLVPTRKGGPGRPEFVPWTEVLPLAGEVVPPDADPTGAERRRYNRRVDALVAEGYLVPPGARIAPKGDTVEIVSVVRGGRGRTTGLEIRASERFCAALVDLEWARVPADLVLPARVRKTSV